MTRERLEWIALIALVALIGGGWIFLPRETEADNPPIPLTLSLLHI